MYCSLTSPVQECCVFVLDLEELDQEKMLSLVVDGSVSVTYNNSLEKWCKPGVVFCIS